MSIDLIEIEVPSPIDAIEVEDAAAIDEVEVIITGPQGPKGDKGDTGATGPTGPTGPQGPTGSALELSGDVSSSAGIATLNAVVSPAKTSGTGTKSAVTVWHGDNTWRAPRSRVGNTIAFLGDSRVAAQFSDASTSAPYPTSNAHVKSAGFFFNWTNAYLGQRFKTVYNGAVSGYRSDQYLNVNNYTTTVSGVAYSAGCGINHAVDSGASWLMIWGVVNDISQSATTGDTALTIWNRIKSATETALKAGMNVILLTEPGSSSMGTTTSQKQMVNQYNQYLREYAFGNEYRGLFCFDIASYLVDPTLANLTLRTTYSSDGTHQNAVGAEYIGSALASYLGAFVPAVNQQIIGAFEIPANGNIQQLLNPLFITTTGGTSGSGITGSTPANFVTSRTGSATATISVGAAADGFGNAVTINGTFTAAGEQINFRQDTALGNYTTGDIVDSGAHIMLTSGSDKLCMGGLATNFSNSPNPTGDLYNATTSNPLPNKTMDLVLQSTPWVLTTGFSWCSWYARFIAASAGSFTAVINRPWMKRRFAA